MTGDLINGTYRRQRVEEDLGSGLAELLGLPVPARSVYEQAPDVRTWSDKHAPGYNQRNTTLITSRNGVRKGNVLTRVCLSFCLSIRWFPM